jgi:hypothetical protein
MLAAIIHDMAAILCGAFAVLLVQAWLIQRTATAALSGKGISMLGQILAAAVVLAFVAAMMICTWADYAVSGSVRRATGG